MQETLFNQFLRVIALFIFILVILYLTVTIMFWIFNYSDKTLLQMFLYQWQFIKTLRVY